ncbi:hypothetical protein, partial [Escherichia coli]|uniref:hypothetical protein n=1 Tax=Escherichia coli TaxID=562 RepID=UPI00285F2D1A
SYNRHKKKFHSRRDNLSQPPFDDGEQPGGDHDADDTSQSGLKLPEYWDRQRDSCRLVGCCRTRQSGHIWNPARDEA